MGKLLSFSIGRKVVEELALYASTSLVRVGWVVVEVCGNVVGDVWELVILIAAAARRSGLSWTEEPLGSRIG